MSFLAVLVITAQVFAQDDCGQAAEQAQRRCSGALNEANALNSVPAGNGSIQGGSSTMIQNLQRQNFNLTAAGRFCEALKNNCRKKCDQNLSGQNSGSAGHPYTNTDERCTRAALEARGKWVVCSPLVVQMGAVALKLSSPENGTWFDILGARNIPSHAPVKISWFLPEVRGSNQFITLPGSDGKVHGIDQLFGNNTRGPDGEFAANGYAALAKFDLNQDNLIDAADAIFPNLRLWADLNGDGESQPNELTSLAASGVEMIDLSYVDTEPETDAFGNQIKFKSTVKRMFTV